MTKLLRLLLCEHCHRQYDVSTIKIGQWIRCRCGERLQVNETESLATLLLHCAHCGGQIEDGSSGCAYCQSKITAADRHLGAACPHCNSRLMVDANFCSNCGVAISPSAYQSVPIGSACPRCSMELVTTPAVGERYAECGGCAGIWISPVELSKILEKAVSPGIPLEQIFTNSKSGGGQDCRDPYASDPRYLKCPACLDLMSRINFGGDSGIMVDWCGGHGYWFDTFELDKAIQFARAKAVPVQKLVVKQPRSKRGGAPKPPFSRSAESLDSETLMLLDSLAEMLVLGAKGSGKK